MPVDLVSAEGALPAVHVAVFSLGPHALERE